MHFCFDVCGAVEGRPALTAGRHQPEARSEKALKCPPAMQVMQLRPRGSLVDRRPTKVKVAPCGSRVALPPPPLPPPQRLRLLVYFCSPHAGGGEGAVALALVGMRTGPVLDTYGANRTATASNATTSRGSSL